VRTADSELYAMKAIRRRQRAALGSSEAHPEEARLTGQ